MDLQNSKFTELMTQPPRVAKLVKCIDHVEEVLDRLVEQQVFTDQDRTLTLEQQMRQHQKETLVDILAHKNFDLIDRMIFAVDMKLNPSVCVLLKTLKILVYKQHPFARHLLKAPLVSTTDQVNQVNITLPADDDTESMGPGPSGTSTPENRSRGFEYPRTPTFRDSGKSDPRTPTPRSAPVKSGYKEHKDDPAAVELLPIPEVSGSSLDDSGNVPGSNSTTDTSSQDAVSHDSGIEMDSRNLREAIEKWELDDLKLKLEYVDTLDKLVDLDSTSQKTSLHACLLRSNEVLECLKLLLCKFEELQNQTCRNSDQCTDQAWTFQQYIDHQDEKQQTVAHLAAESSLVAVLLTLHKRRCNFFLKDEEGYTAIRLMYLHAPEAVSVILNDAITGKQNHPYDGNFKVEFDFCTVIGISSIKKKESYQKFSPKCAAVKAEEEQAVVVDPTHEETALLAELINQNDAGAKIILPHIIVKLFLEFKWAKMRNWFLFSILTQILLHLIYTVFVIQVFLIDCRHGKTTAKASKVNFEAAPKQDEEDDPPESVLNYVFGTWAPVVQVFNVGSENAQQCKLDSHWLIVALFLFVFGGVLFFFKEAFEVYLKYRKSKSCFEGIKSYLSTMENVLQVLSAISVMWVTSLAFSQTLTDSHYSAASISVIISWGLILMQLGNFSGMGIYVQILGKVIKRFATLMAVYIVIIIAFSISFSIMFPHEKPFQTLPQAISRVLIMMTGEFNYDETFYGEDQSGGPSIPLTGHFIFGCFAILLTIILMNLLIGMVVSDVNSLKGKSEVVLLSIKIDQISVMENTLIHIRKILLFPRCVFNSCKRMMSSEAAKPYYLDIYVISLYQSSKEKRSNDRMTIKKKIKEIPKYLQKQLINFATTGSSEVSDSMEQKQFGNICPTCKKTQ